jgi:hypothetical protein
MFRQKMCTRVLSIVFVMLCALASNCLISSHSFNCGTLLDPGETAVGLGCGISGYKNIFPNISTGSTRTQQGYDSLIFSDTAFDTVSGQTITASVDYRLGILQKLPLGRGLEFGFHIEEPIVTNGVAIQALEPILEMGVIAGIPDRPCGSWLVHQNIGTGFQVGLWVDNGWFLEHAISAEQGRFTPYLVNRIELTATTPRSNEPTESAEDNFFSAHDRKLLYRGTFGLKTILPKLRILPDGVFTECTLVAPNPTRLQPVQVHGSLGFQWTKGL